MTEQDRPAARDYGYDMAHDDTDHRDAKHRDRAQQQGRGAPAPGDQASRRHGTVHPGGTPDSDGDYGYDEAHGF